MHREAADIAAGEEQRRNDVGVRRDDQAAGASGGQDRTVVALRQPLVAQVAKEQFLDQLRHGAPARAVGHFDHTIPPVQRASKDLPRIGHSAPRHAASR